MLLKKINLVKFPQRFKGANQFFISTEVIVIGFEIFFLTKN